MKHHVQNPWTKKPSLMVNLSVEESQQLLSALKALGGQYLLGSTDLDANQEDACRELVRTLERALETPRPAGIKGCDP